MLRKKIPLIEVIQVLLKRLHENVKTSEDVISRAELPEFKLIDMPANIKKYGELTIKKHIEYQASLNTIRTSATEQLKAKFPEIPAKVSTTAVAITLCGVGECHETSNRLILDLIAEGYDGVLTQILVEGKRNVLQNEPYSHVFFLVGKPDIKLVHVTDLEKVDESILLVDGLLNVVGKACDYKKLIGSYLDAHQTYNISMCQQLATGNVDVERIYKNATALAQAIKADIQEQKYHTKITSNSALVFANITQANSPYNLLIAQIVAEFDAHERQSEIAEALRSDIELAFRKVCAYGNAKAITLMMKNQELLLHFDMHTTSKTSNKTAANWVELNKRLSNEERKYILESIQNDAKVKSLARKIYGMYK